MKSSFAALLRVIRNSAVFNMCISLLLESVVERYAVMFGAFLHEG